MARPTIKSSQRRTKWLKIRVNSAEAAAFKRKLGKGFSTKLRNRTLQKS